MSGRIASSPARGSSVDLENVTAKRATTPTPSLLRTKSVQDLLMESKHIPFGLCLVLLVAMTAFPVLLRILLTPQAILTVPHALYHSTAYRNDWPDASLFRSALLSFLATFASSTSFSLVLFQTPEILFRPSFVIIFLVAFLTVRWIPKRLFRVLYLENAYVRVLIFGLEGICKAASFCNGLDRVLILFPGTTLRSVLLGTLRGFASTGIRNVDRGLQGREVKRALIRESGRYFLLAFVYCFVSYLSRDMVIRMGVGHLLLDNAPHGGRFVRFAKVLCFSYLLWFYLDRGLNQSAPLTPSVQKLPRVGGQRTAAKAKPR
eukprot:GILK01005124.1.p1 GENE.GILK01005124.1~~GILK01005124.1.p1  ORF type:complete len:319 (-),score=28.98 GILK01005124.1:258-1214(-)